MDPGDVVADRVRVLVVGDVEVTDRYHVVRAHVVSADELHLHAVLVPEAHALGHERLDVVVAGRAGEQLHHVVVVCGDGHRGQQRQDE